MIPATFAVLDLDAVRHNLTIARNCAPDAKIMAVIKANGYGHGLIRIAHALAKADAFAVARVDEGIRLRAAGFKNRIAVLEGFTFKDELDEFLNHDLEPVIHSLSQLDIMEKRPKNGKIRVWLKIDTGMNRLGFKTIDFEKVYQRLHRSQIINHPVNLMTHLANADDKKDDKTLRQTTLFNQTIKNYGGPRSIANSAGILGWPLTISDWVRPGIMLYGISPFPGSYGKEFGLKPVMGLYSHLIAVKSIEQGETVGYGSVWTCEKPTTYGVAAIGYGDGYPRYAEAGTPVLVNGKRVPLIGRVSMDMITVDLESQPDAKPGDPVVLWGDELPVEEIARHAGTIPYTLVCGVTQRVQFVEERILHDQ